MTMAGIIGDITTVGLATIGDGIMDGMAITGDGTIHSLGTYF